MKPILVKGKNGQIGWELRRTLAPLGSIAAPGRESLDLSNPDSIRRQIRAVTPDVIVNTAAYTAVDLAESDPDTAMAVNATAPGVMAEEAARIGAALIHYSTDYVFDGDADRPYSEADPPNPRSRYGLSKLAGETAVQAFDFPYLIFRTAWVYGRRGRNFLLAMQRLMTERSELTVVDDQFGAPTWSRMIAEATAQVLVQCREVHSNGPVDIGSIRGVYHVTCGGKTSWHGFATAIRARTLSDSDACRITPVPTTAYPTPAPRPRYSVLDNGKLMDTFGFLLPDWHIAFTLCTETSQ